MKQEIVKIEHESDFIDKYVIIIRDNKINR